MSSGSLIDYGNTIIFILAVIHTFLAPSLHRYAIHFSQNRSGDLKNWKRNHVIGELLFLISEIELILGIWLIPLFCWLIYHSGLKGMQEYIDTREYTHAIYISVIVIVMSSRPVIQFAEKMLEGIARIGRDTPGAWWWTIMTIGPFLTAILKEPGAMTVSSIVLVDKFYRFRPSKAFRYATMGLLFSNISIAGLFSPHSSRSLFFSAAKWEWTTDFMLTYFGFKILLGIILANALYFFIFKHEFKKHFPQSLPKVEKEFLERPAPFWVTFVNLVFVGFIEVFANYPTLYLAFFFMFLAFWRITGIYQGKSSIKEAVYIGLFFASLVIHGQLQGWWMIPLISNLGDNGTMLFSFGVSAFADNAIVNYLATEIPFLSEEKQYLIVTATMCAGGLTVISNAPNPVGIRILRQEFDEEISFLALFLGAFFPAILHLMIFKFFHVYSF